MTQCCSCPSLAWGWIGGPRPGGAIGRNQGSVIGEGTSPGAGGRCRAELFWESGLGLCWPLSQFQLEHLEGLGVLVPSQKGEGGLRTCSLQETVKLQGACQSKLEPCAWQGSYLDSLQCGAGEGLVWGTGRAPWEAGTGFAAPKQEAATETPKQLCSEVMGRNNTPSRDRMGAQSCHSSQLASPPCVSRTVGDREGTVLRRAHSGLGIQCF